MLLFQWVQDINTSTTFLGHAVQVTVQNVQPNPIIPETASSDK